MDIIESWAYIEADFQREYGMDLMREIGSMTWRRFSILLKGLSGDSVFVIVNTEENDGATVLDGDSPQAADAVKSFFG